MIRYFHGMLLLVAAVFFVFPVVANADVLTLTSGNNATTTPNVATSISGFQIVGNGASTTPVKIYVTSGTVRVSATSGVTISGNNSDTLNLSGTVTNLNSALSTLTYTRGSTGTDTLEVALVNPTEIFFADNGHLYKFTSGSFTWSAAKSAAEAQSAYGATGYLATVTSDEENTFIYQRLSGDGWLSATDSETEKTWKWAAGPESGTAFYNETTGLPISGGYNGWASGEPNDYGSGEDCGYMYSSQNGEWNDFPCSAQQGYVVEFGADGALPTVVSRNVSIVTADVPAVTTLFPSTGSTNATTTANLAISFSKTVTKDTGNILIKKYSDDSTVDTIDVASAQVTGGGSNSIVIDPSVTLLEGVQYYVIIPGTAFKDGSNNYFNGISSKTTWTFTTADVTAPLITSLAANSSASTSASVTWTTNEGASTRVLYGLTSALGATTSEANTSPRVTSHTTTLSPLLSCTTYHYRAVSRDQVGNSATSTASSFTTGGCAGSTTPSVATSTTITASAGGTTLVETESKTFTVTTPPAVTATSSTLVIQVQAIASDAVLASIGRPQTISNEVGATVFDVKAIINGSTILDSFDAEVTIEYEYTDSEIDGLDESSLKLFHYTNGQWVMLNDCDLDTTANTISCTTPSFSIFGLFGDVEESTEESSGSSIHKPFGCKDPNASNYKYFSHHKQELCVYGEEKKVENTSVGVCAPHIRSYIGLNVENDAEDVRKLETFLNEKQGENLPVDGVYSKEDAEAVKRFQKKHASEVLGVWGLAEPTGYVYRTTLMKINSFYCSASIQCPAFVEHNSVTENTSSAEVEKTKVLLTELGFFKGEINTTFDASLGVSLKKFQETFSETMLKPWNLSYGTGYKYKTTNKFLNMLVGCETPAVELDGAGTFDY
ncbi:Ig-like domain-containing protein [Patescibacteria group bacterium]|nr:Ig-like domain-containing protein [Patescibacteria group bacterium]